MVCLTEALAFNGLGSSGRVPSSARGDPLEAGEDADEEEKGEDMWRGGKGTHGEEIRWCGLSGVLWDEVLTLRRS
jgi:hypothetical protein